MTLDRRPQLYLNFDPEHDFLLALEFGRIDEGQTEGSWHGHSGQLGFLHDGPDGRCLGFRLQDQVGAYDPDDEENEALWREGPRFDVPLLGLTDVATNEVIVAALTHFDGRMSHNRELFHAAMGEGDAAKAFELWQRCLESGDAMAHYALGYTAFELGRLPQAYRHLRHYAELAPCEPWAHAWYGRAAGAIGERGEAYDAFERAIELEQGRDEATEAADWLDEMDAPSRLEEAIEQLGAGRAWSVWEGDERVGGDPRGLVHWPRGPVMAELDLAGGTDGEAFLEVEVGRGDADKLRRAELPGGHWLVARHGRVWLAASVGMASGLDSTDLPAAVEALFDAVQGVRVQAEVLGFAPPSSFTTIEATASFPERLDSAPARPQVVYGEALGHLVIAEEGVADAVARTWAALRQATTWGELKALASAADYQHCVHYRDPGDDEELDEDADAPPEPPADAPFSLEQVTTIGDGDFPPSPVDLQGDWLPDVVLALGIWQRVGMVGRDWIMFDPADEAVIVEALKQEGYAVRRDDALVTAACDG